MSATASCADCRYFINSPSALESLVPVLIHLNKTYKSPGAGVRFTNLPRAG